MATIRLDGPQIEELKNLLGAAFLPPRFTEFCCTVSIGTSGTIPARPMITRPSC